MFAAHGERLARRPAGDQVDAPVSAVLEILDVAFRHIRPWLIGSTLCSLLWQMVLHACVFHSTTARCCTCLLENASANPPAPAKLDRLQSARRQQQVFFVKRGGEGLLVHGFECDRAESVWLQPDAGI